jgi:hypothetical protein
MPDHRDFQRVPPDERYDTGYYTVETSRFNGVHVEAKGLHEHH